MRAAAMFAVLSLAACAVPPAVPPPSLVCVDDDCRGEDAERVAHAKAWVSGMMNVPDSTVFRSVYVTSRGVCGTVTAINALGGYSQAKPFLVVGDELQIAISEDTRTVAVFGPEGERRPSIYFSYAWRDVCEPIRSAVSAGDDSEADGQP